MKTAPIRVLLITSDFAGGTGVHLGRLLENVDRSRFVVRVLSLGIRHIEPPQHVGCKDITLGGGFRRFPLAQLRQFAAVRSEAQRFTPDVVHAYFFWSILYGRTLRATGAVPRLVENREDAGFSLSGLDRTLLRWSAHLPDRVIAVSDAVATAAATVEPSLRERLLVIRNGVDPAPVSVGSERRAQLRADIGAGPDDPVVAMVAMLNRPVKGVHHFIDAMPRIVAAVPRVRFVFFGDGPDRPAHQAHVDRLGVAAHVHFAGLQRDMSHWYSAMDLSVLTSLSEGLSITVLESMSHGIPVVVTRVGGNPELVDHDRTGLLVPPADPASFADAVVSLLRDPGRRAELGARAKQRVREHFALDRVARRYEDAWTFAAGRTT